MYQNRFVVAVRVNNSVVAEQEPGKVLVPFGTEYSIFLKNLNNRRALAQVTIDGADVSGGQRFIVPANGYIDVTRFITNGNLNQGNSFKFLKHTSGTKEHRGVRSDDGLIRVEFWLEQVPQYAFNTVYPVQPQYDWISKGVKLGEPLTGYSSGPDFGLLYNSVGTASSKSEMRSMEATAALSANCVGFAAAAAAEPGFTAPGSVNNQQFATGAWFATETQSEVIVLQLVGEVAQAPVQKVVPARSAPKCSSCGRRNRASSKFCSECGTSLILV
jgi:hypothetical protein